MWNILEPVFLREERKNNPDKYDYMLLRKQKFGYNKIPPKQFLIQKYKTLLNKYRHKVYWLSHKIYNKNKRFLNPNNYRLGKCGENGHQLDHIIPVRKCFDKGWSIEKHLVLKIYKF
jgi:hypothetical protein